MTSKEKKEWLILVGILVVTGLIIYFNFFKPSPPPPPALPGQVGVATPEAGGAPAATAPGSTGAHATFLPNGSKIDLNILSDPRFTTLTPPVYPTVDPSEVGKPNDNPFQ